MNKALSFKPDWSELWTAKKAEEQLEGFKFKGPGWYIRSFGTMLVVPEDRTLETAWNMQSVNADERFYFHMYDGWNPGSIFGSIAHAPTREDERYNNEPLA